MELKICTHCGAEMSEGAGYCKACGSRRRESGSVLDRKKSRVLATGKNRMTVTALIAGAVLVLVSGWVFYNVHKAKSLSFTTMTTPGQRILAPPVYTRISQEGGVVRVPLRDLDDGTVRYYIYATGARNVKFFVLRASDGSIRASLDACTACYRAKAGYRQNGDSVVCNNCGMTFKSTEIGIMTGGCSPIALNKKVEGQALALRAKELEAGAEYF